MKRTIKQNMNRMILGLVLLLPLFCLNVSAQIRGGATADKYYFTLTRPDCCNLPVARWRGAAATLGKAGVPTLFGLADIIDYRQSWRPAKIRRTPPDEGSLIVGPFASEAAAVAALRKLPRLLPRAGDEFHGLESGTTTTPQTWQIGFYQIDGFITNLPLTVQKPAIVHQSGVMDAVIVERNEGASGYGITVESKGIRYYIYMAGNGGGVKTQIGDVDTVGNRVRVTYKSKRKETEGYSLDATRIVQIK